MERVVLHWNDRVIPFSGLDKAPPTANKRGYYCICGGLLERKQWKHFKLLYIGKAYTQTIRERALQTHPASDKCIDKYLLSNSGLTKWLMYGWIKTSSQKRMSEEFFSDVEAGLIFSHQPQCNSDCKIAYQGRSLEIVNEGGIGGVIKSRCICLPEQ